MFQPRHGKDIVDAGKGSTGLPQGAEIEGFRLKLRAAGFAPLPVNGKIPSIEGWSRLGDATEHEIRGWTRSRPAETNTGILTRTAPALDIDILDPKAAAAVERLARERCEKDRVFPVRFGNPPKRAVLFRCDEPFEKIALELIAPSGADGEKLEFLANGQQIVVDGIHPDTHKPYSWHAERRPGDFRREDLPPIDQKQAQALIDGAADLLVRDYGYSRKADTKPKAAKAAANSQGDRDRAADWGEYLANLDDHRTLARFAGALLKSGMSDGAAVNYLRAQVEALTNIDKDRRARRLREIPAAVSSAREKIDAAVAAQVPPPELATLDDVVAAFRKWLALDDPAPLYAALGAVAANFLPAIRFGLASSPRRRTPKPKSSTH
jgi:hypothetical protein